MTMPDGILVIDKPADWTSMDVCAKLRGILRERRIGHAGTLDPMATGVLPVFVGRATRAIQFAETGRKVYQAVLRLGCVTDTQDSSGTVIGEKPVDVTREQILDILPEFTGEIWQIPPMYSAIRKDGKRLYELARAGKEVEREARRIHIYGLTLGEQLAADSYALTVECSRGTYVRTLCHDIGAALGCGGVMAALRRTESSGFTLSQAVTMEQVAEAGAALLLPMDSIFTSHPALTLNAAQETRCRNGNRFVVSGLADGTYRLYGADGSFLALSRAEHGELTAIRNFFSN